MSVGLWLLVEWLDESDPLPTYGVVNVDLLTYTHNELNIGKDISICKRRDSQPRRARILMISDNKHQVKAQKRMKERQDSQVKNVLTMCIRALKGIQSSALASTPSSSPIYSADVNTSRMFRGLTPPPPVTALETDDTSDSDVESIRVQNESMASYYRRTDPGTFGHHSLSDISYSDRTLINNTPPPLSEVREIMHVEKKNIMVDKATQTNSKDLRRLERKIKEMYSLFLGLTSSLNLDVKSDCFTFDQAEIEETVEDMCIDQIEIEISDQIEQSASRTAAARRTSATTTSNIEPTSSNSDDMIAIGSGKAIVPSRLMNEIDWNSYTIATRQLLESVFPRRILATHSLTGKQSPAFKDRPPKKCLDPELVDDIVQTVSARCGVPGGLVRNAITTKCTDESKLFRNRQQHMMSRHERQQNEDCTPPSSGKSTSPSSVDGSPPYSRDARRSSSREATSDDSDKSSL